MESSFRLEYCIEHDQEFAHSSHDGDLRWFTSLSESPIEWSYFRIEPQGCHCRHVQHVANRWSTSGDLPFASHEAAVAVHRCNTDQACNLLPIQMTEFR